MEDGGIIELYFARKEEAITVTREKYGGYLHAIAMRILEQPQEAEECENDTYLQAWQSIPPTRPLHLGAYLSRITRNLSLKRLKANRAVKRGGGSLPVPLAELEEVLGDGTVEAELEAKELAKLLDAFLDTQTPKTRMIFLRRYFLCQSVAEIARELGCSTSNVKTCLSRVRMRLKDELIRKGVYV